MGLIDPMQEARQWTNHEKNPKNVIQTQKNCIFSSPSQP
jgi:hypothetical protein